MNQYKKPLDILNSVKTLLYSTQFHTVHQDLHITPPHFPYIPFTSHPALIPFPLLHLADLHPTSNPFTSLHFTSLHFTYHFPTLFLEILDFLHTLKSLHFTALNTSLNFSLYILDFPSLKNPFTYHTSAPSPGNTRFPGHFEFPSLHFTSPHFIITFLILFLKVLGLEGKLPKAFTDNLFQSWMFLFTKEYFPICVLCLLFLIFQS
jgi:hypothetical protein